MKLIELLNIVSDETHILISQDPTDPGKIFSGKAGDITVRTANKYEVVDVSAMCTPITKISVGIIVIVKEKE